MILVWGGYAAPENTFGTSLLYGKKVCDSTIVVDKIYSAATNGCRAVYFVLELQNPSHIKCGVL
jgi:hypothetical protein